MSKSTKKAGDADAQPAVKPAPKKTKDITPSPDVVLLLTDIKALLWDIREASQFRPGYRKLAIPPPACVAEAEAAEAARKEALAARVAEIKAAAKQPEKPPAEPKSTPAEQSIDALTKQIMQDMEES